jgi:acetoin utilization deacetylase AcuC-like enzyme
MESWTYGVLENRVNRIGILRDPLFLLHANGPGHPESPERLRAVSAMLEAFPLRDLLVDLPSRDVTREELSWIHEERYIRKVELTRDVPRTMFDADTAANEHSYLAAVRAAGGVISCVEAVTAGVPAAGGLAAAFALVRPPGHHAEAGHAMGFCLFNNVAVAAEYALRRLGFERVLVFDWDVHHGNGTMHSFYGTNRVLFLSIHQFPHYPGTGRVEEIGAGPAAGYTVNVPLPPGQGDADYAAVVERVLRPIALQYRPQLILVSAGFDIARVDPLAGRNVTQSGFARMTDALLSISAACCPGRLVFVLEGGYQLDALAGGVSVVLSTLANGGAQRNEQPGRQDSGPSRETQAVIEAVRQTLRPYWLF